MSPIFSSSGPRGQKGFPGVTLPPTGYERQFGDSGYPGEIGLNGISGGAGSPGIPGGIGKY